MIVTREEMIDIEQNSTLNTRELINTVGEKLAEYIQSEIPKDKKLLIVAGKGNNGADALVLAALIKDIYNLRIYLISDNFSSPYAKEYYETLDKTLFINELKDEYDVIIDGIYGFSFHPPINEREREIFKKLNCMHAYKISIDINSGAMANDYKADEDAFKSDITLSLGAYKVFHMYQKIHHLFKEKRLIRLPLNLEHSTTYHEMNDEIFIDNYPFLKEDSYKGQNGKGLVIGGSYGMAGALMFNLIGVRSFGDSYTYVILDESIYPIIASSLINPVYHPCDNDTYERIIKDMIPKTRTILYGSGVNNLEYKEDILRILLSEFDGTLIIDAEGLRILKKYLDNLQNTRARIILTPHMGEFANLIDTDINTLRANRMELALDFVKKYHVTLILKDVITLLIKDDKHIFINNHGNEALSKAGSGDILSGMIMQANAMINDDFKASMMAVWLFNHLIEMIAKDHSKTIYNHELYPVYADKFFREHGK